jgi:ankyrin repeat protein
MSGEGEVSGSGSGTSLPSSLNGMGTQTFSDIHNSDHSRSHFGNVYNTGNVYNNNSHADPTRPKSDEEKAQDMMNALAFEGMGIRLMTTTPACADTCTWFLRTQYYTRWRSSAHRNSYHGILWIKGKAGTGKSTLMKYVHDYTQKQYQDDRTVAFFFNRRSPESLMKSTEGMYRSILHQLYARIPRLKMAAVQHFSIAGQSIWSNSILESLLREAIISLTESEIVTCYVDALDECETDEVRSAIKFFGDLALSATHENVKFFVCFSSRYYPQISLQHHVEVKLDAMPEHSQDITTYLTKMLTIRAPSRSELQTDIQQKCSGIFLWVVLVVKMLNDEFDRGATKSELRKTLTSVPDELDTLFARISEPLDEPFQVAMRWVLFAGRTLTTQELYFAIMTGTGHLSSGYWDDDEVGMDTIHNYILHVSRGLIEWEIDIDEVTSAAPRNNRVQFIHESVREYLLGRGFASAEYASRQDFQSKSHEKMAEDCQKYLRLCLHGQHGMPRSPDEPGRTPKNLRLFQRKYPLCDYVWHNFLVHVESACKSSSTDHPSLDRVPVHDYISLDSILCLHGAKFYSRDSFSPFSYFQFLLRFRRWKIPQTAMVVPDHPSAFLMLLIRNECYTLAEIILQNTVAPSLDDRDDTGESKASVASMDPTELGLTTLSGGRWGSSLHAAIVSKRQNLVQLLLDRGADVNLAGDVVSGKNTQQYISPLLLAIQLGGSETVKILLDYIPSLDSYGLKHGFDALHIACECLDLETIALLLRRGADVNHVYQGKTALHLVSTNFLFDSQRGPVISALLNAGADVNAIDKNGDTALILACRAGGRSKIVTLLDHGADIGLRSSESGTALDVARRTGNFELVDFLLTQGATGKPLGLPSLLGERLRRFRIRIPSWETS